MTAELDLPQAYELFQARRLEEAETACRRLVARDAADAPAVHLLALVRKAQGDQRESEQLMLRSIELAPNLAEFRANLGNLLRSLGRSSAALAAYRAALLQDARHGPSRLGLARTLSETGAHKDAETELRALLAEDDRNAGAWSSLGLALREQGLFKEAESAFRRALELEPGHAIAHHNLGALLSQMERAEEAMVALDRAKSLGLATRESEYNRGRALLQLYRVADSERAFADAVRHEPANIEAQMMLAKVRYMQGDRRFTRDIVHAAEAARGNDALQLLLGDVLRRAGDLASAEKLLRGLLARRKDFPEAQSALATILHEAGHLEEAETLAATAAAALPNNPLVIENLVGILLSRGYAEDAMPFIKARRLHAPEDQRWIAYAAVAARLLGDPLYKELYDYERFVRVYDLEPPAGWASIAELHEALRPALEARHVFTAHPLDQSLRGGTQTARSLLADNDPAIQGLIRAFDAPIAAYREHVGTAADHPLTSRNRGRAVLAGCWSVKLSRNGFHVNHIHPQGWLSSAYYVSVPAEVNDEKACSGWLTLGEPRHPVPGVTPERVVQPKPGRLVLFPSYMWHGTSPIHGDEPRMSVAFDVVTMAE